MKVPDNLENYEIPQGFHLTADEEEQFASDLKEIVAALIPIRGSKLKTRKYFNSHLRYTSNVRDAERNADLPPGFFDEDKDYTPLPGEYTWNSDLLQPALRDILMPDHWSFGFVLNYITLDTAERRKERVYEGQLYSDAIVKFALKFDLDEIRAQAKAIPDLAERVVFLNGVMTEYRIYDGLSRDEEQWTSETVFPALQALVDEAEKELKVKNSAAKRSIHIEAPPKQSQRASTFQPNRSFLTEDVLYDFSLCNYPQFAVLRMTVSGGILTDPPANEFAMTSTLADLFRRCYDPDNKLVRNKIIFEDYPRFFLGLLDSYSTHMRQKYAEDRRLGLRLLCRWMAKTRNFIDDAHTAQPEIYLNSRGVPDFDTDPKDTWPLKLALLSPIYQSFRHYAKTFIDDLTPQMAKVIPFNMWEDQYESLRAKYQGVLGLEFDQRAVIYLRDNVKRFYDTLMDQCMIFCNQMNGVDNLLTTEDEIFMGCYKPMTSLLHKYFRDFVQRIQSISRDAKEIDDAVFHWLFSLQSEVFDNYAKNQHIIKRKCGANSRTEKAMMRFFFDICEKNVFDIAIEYFLDTEDIPLVKEDVPKVEVPKQEAQKPAPVQPAAAPKKTEGEDKPLHDKTVNYEKLYNEWKGVAFTGVTLEEFTYAIDKADFSLLMEKANDAGVREGYIVSVKFIIKRLGQHLGNNWYDIACLNIGQTMNAINKINDGTKRIGKINTKILSDCIK